MFFFSFVGLSYEAKTKNTCDNEGEKKRTSQMLCMFVVTLGEIEMCDARAAGCLGPGWTGFSVNCQIIVSTY